MTGITGLGSYVPDRILTNEDLEKIVDTNDKWITARTGIKERRIVDSRELDHVAAMGIAAAKQAIANSGTEKINYLICATNSQAHIFPATGIKIQDKIKDALGLDAFALDIQAGCTGFLAGLDLAALAVPKYKHVLVIATDALSKTVNYNDRETCILFGDGAGAAVVSEKGGSEIIASFVKSDLCCLENGSYPIALRTDAFYRNDPFQKQQAKPERNYLTMEGGKVFEFVLKNIPDTFTKVIKETSYGLEDIHHIIMHQGNGKMNNRALDKIARQWEYPGEKLKAKVHNTLHRYGNTSCASIAVTYAEVAHAGKIKKGDLVCFIGFGAGLTEGITLIRY